MILRENKWWGWEGTGKQRNIQIKLLDFFFHTASKLLRFKILETHQVGGQIAYDGVRTKDRVIAWLSGEHGKYLYVCLSRNCGISKWKKMQWMYSYQTAPVITFHSHYCAHNLIFFSFMNFYMTFNVLSCIL